MGCGSSMNKGETVGAPQAVAEAEEAALARMREDNAELRRQNTALTDRVQELSQRLNTLTMDVSGLRMEMSAAAATATKALQAAQAATERVEAAATASGPARPPTAPGPIPIPAPESQLLLRVQQLESQLAGLQDKVEGHKAKEEFAKQLRAAQGDRPPGALPPPHPNNASGSSVGGGGISAVGRPSYDHGSTGGSAASGNGGGTATPVIDGNGLLPTNNNFPTRFGGGPAALRPARDRTPVRQPGSGGLEDWSAHGQSSAPAMMQTVQNGPPGGEFMSTHRYGNVLPSDLKLAEQRKQGPKQFL